MQSLPRTSLIIGKPLVGMLLATWVIPTFLLALSRKSAPCSGDGSGARVGADVELKDEVSGGIVTAPIVSGVAATGVDCLVVEGMGGVAVTKKGRLLVEVVGLSAAGAGGLLLTGSEGVELPETGEVGASSPLLTTKPPP